MIFYCPKCGEEKEIEIDCLYHDFQFICPDCEIKIRVEFEIDDPEEEKNGIT